MLVDDGPAGMDRYLKCLAQCRFAQSLGVHFKAFDDYSVYCSWLQDSCRAVPLDASLERECLVVVPSNSPMSVRRRTRARLDRHAAHTLDDTWVTVLRMTAGSYFPHMQLRPIYASIDDARARILRGVVETGRGATWFSIVGHKNVPQTMQSLFRIWSGFIELFERLVRATEAIAPAPLTDTIEIRLDFACVVMPDTSRPQTADAPPGAPHTSVDSAKRLVTITWPEDFWVAFRGPSNDGEKMVIRHLAEGLLALHIPMATDRVTLDALVHAVIPRDGMRVVHLFEGDTLIICWRSNTKQ